METTDVLVVGAGPTGLALACGLRLHGVSVRLIDRAGGPATTSRANFLHARGSEVLGRLGGLGTLPSQARRALTVTTYLGDRPLMKLRFGDVQRATAAPPMLISQARVEATLRERLADLGVVPEWDTALTDLESHSSGVTATLANGKTIQAGWLVGCDGSGSTVRKCADIGFPGVRVSERFLLADAHIDWDIDRTGTTGWVHPDGMVGAMPMPEADGRDDLWRLLAYDPAGEPAADPEVVSEVVPDRTNEEQILDRLREIMPARTGRSRMQIRDAIWASVFSVHRRVADGYRAGRVLLAGDAAHVHSPFGGQGMLTGLGDAENLAWKLALVARGLAEESLLDSYQAERRPLATQVLRNTTAVTKINIAGTRWGRFVRDRIVVRAFNLPWLQRWSTYTASQLWVSYHEGPLGGSRFTRLGRKPRPGDRVPDHECVRVDGGTTRLHAELGGQWALLLPESGGDDAVDATRAYLGAYVVPLRSAARLPAPICLVRPDGHLGWRGRAGDAAALGQWLEHALQQGRTVR